VADIDTDLASWRTDIRIFNSGSTTQTVTMTFFPLSGANALTATAVVEPGEVEALEGVLRSVFGVENTGGTVHVTTAQPSSLVVTARTYNLTSHGTFGQFVPAVTAADGVGAGERSLEILQVESSARYRTNLGVSEITGKPVTVQVTVTLPDSRVSPQLLIPLKAFEYRQLPLFDELQLHNVYNARISVRVIGGAGKAAACASVIDMQTQDPTYIPAQ
jgi:hypothetical protein